MEIKNQHIEVEKHPLEPFLPVNAKLLMLGKFSTAKSEVVYGVLLPESAKWYVEDIWGDYFSVIKIIF